MLCSVPRWSEYVIDEVLRENERWLPVITASGGYSEQTIRSLGGHNYLENKFIVEVVLVIGS